MEKPDDLTTANEKKEPTNQENLKIDTAEPAEIIPEEKKENIEVPVAAEESEENALSQIRNKIDKIEGSGHNRELAEAQKREIFEEEKDYMGQSMAPEKYEKMAEELSKKGDHEAAAKNFHIAADMFARIMYSATNIENPPKIKEWDDRKKEMWRKYADEYQKLGNFKEYIIGRRNAGGNIAKYIWRVGNVFNAWK